MPREDIRIENLDARVQEAVKQFWSTRLAQTKRQGKSSGRRDTGSRKAVTGGKHLDGFVDLLRDLVAENCESAQLFKQMHNRDPATVLPGYFRPTKYWDLVVMIDDRLVACVELKSHIGPSFGNNYNNRSEEAIGNATDVKTAYREGAFAPSPKPWVGYLMLLEEAEKSTQPVKAAENHFPVFAEFRDASYAKRYEVGITRLVRDALYDRACLLLTQKDGRVASWREPCSELAFRQFAAGLIGHTLAIAASG